MQRTYPDDGATQSTYIAPDIDMAELAARLGSPVTWRRDGRVLSLTNFSPDADGWILSSGGATVEIASSDYIYSGDASCHLFTAVNPPATGNIYKRIPLPTSSRLGLEVMLCEYVATNHKVELTIYRAVNPTTTARARVQIDLLNGTISYFDSAGAYQLFYTKASGGFSREMNHNFKLVADFENNTYLRMFADDVLTEMPFVLNNFVGAIDTAMFEIAVVPQAVDGLINIYIDNAIITSSEY